MPGMVVKPSANKSTSSVSTSGAGRVNPDQSNTSASWIRERTTSTPSSVSLPQSISNSKLLPAPSEDVRPGVAPSRRKSSNNLIEPLPYSEAQSRTPFKPDSLHKQDLHHSPSVSKALRSPALITSSSPVAPGPAQIASQPLTTHSLARPITPHVRPTSTGPQIPASKNPSPAFLKPPQQKDLTPSLSRLQGRGFVQSMTKLSSELEAASGGDASPQRTPKKSSVLDRWPAAQRPSPSPSPSHLQAVPMRKSRTIDSPTTLSQPDNVTRPATSSQRADPRHSASMPEPHPRNFVDKVQSAVKNTTNSGPGLGSSNTLISFVKPTKTGDDPPTDVEHRSVSRDVDELGVRKKASVGKLIQHKAKSEVSEVAVAQPLSHVRSFW